MQSSLGPVAVHECAIDLGQESFVVPYVDVVGTAGAGPHLTVVAGIHGTEYTSIAAARAWAATLRPDQLCGHVTVVPVVNLPAFWARSPFVVPLDKKNLNRSFPGDAHGTAAERIAHAVTDRFIAGSDYLLDLHAGDLPAALEPFVLYDESPVAGQARELAHAYGLGAASWTGPLSTCTFAVWPMSPVTSESQWETPPRSARRSSTTDGCGCGPKLPAGGERRPHLASRWRPARGSGPLHHYSAELPSRCSPAPRVCHSS